MKGDIYVCFDVSVVKTSKHTYTQPYAHIQAHICTHTRTYAHLQTHMQTHMHILSHIQPHTHSHTQNGREGLIFPILGQVGQLASNNNVQYVHVSTIITV